MNEPIRIHFSSTSVIFGCKHRSPISTVWLNILSMIDLACTGHSQGIMKDSASTVHA
ncbi:hypothetical protein PILCRDRAFT_327880 [Piloderma croceum F 1598]|uniref:Uncharacterized protein n=1 Tax=Piloderma croceum (strain F 1598) TaxID=765440 RepID=A0A0C3G3J6_PILCF|nr:hypothetical protein PILCRDRAFT_327880 [Piloderma croceum F 1598]